MSEQLQILPNFQHWVNCQLPLRSRFRQLSGVGGLSGAPMPLARWCLLRGSGLNLQGPEPWPSFEGGVQSRGAPASLSAARFTDGLERNTHEDPLRTFRGPRVLPSEAVRDPQFSSATRVFILR